MTSDPGNHVNELADRLLRLYLESNPLEATLLGFREYDALLPDLSRASELALADRMASIRSMAAEIDPNDLTPQEAVTREVVIQQVEYLENLRMAESLDYTVAAFPVSPASVALAYVRMAVLTNPRQAEDYLARLRALPAYLTQAQERLAEGRDRGLSPVAHLVTMAIDQIDMFLSSDPNPLAISPPPDWDGAEDWARVRDTVIASVVG